jgi:hypothetical protein
MKVIILNHDKLAVSAASGLEVYKNNLYIISDNTEGISVCDFKGNLQKAILLDPNISPQKVFEKKFKSDYEACSVISRNNSDFMLLIGSGSKKEHRNSAKLVSLAGSNHVETFDLEAFYEEFRKKAHIKLEDFNLEALAYYDQKLYFFNRGTNEIISLKQNSFFDFIHGELTDLKIKKYRIELNDINGAKSGISGATISENGIVLFCASAEETNDWYNDGEIVGSSIGWFHINEMEKHFQVFTQPLVLNGNIIKTKIESLAIEFIDDEKAKLFLVADNDVLDSELFNIEVIFQGE